MGGGSVIGGKTIYESGVHQTTSAKGSADLEEELTRVISSIQLL